jgi:hypothetical protein
MVVVLVKQIRRGHPMASRISIELKGVKEVQLATTLVSAAEKDANYVVVVPLQ